MEAGMKPRLGDAQMQEHPSCPLLGQLLLSSKAVMWEKLEQALSRQESSGEPLGNILTDMGAVSPEQLEHALRAQLRLRGRAAHGRAFLLVIDDDPEVGALLCEILEGAGYRVGVAENGAEAESSLMASDGVRPAAIVLDIGLPGAGGIELLTLIRDDPATCSIPVIVLTGLPDSEAQIRERGLAISEFLAKPVSARRLLEAVEDVLGQIPAAPATR